MAKPKQRLAFISPLIRFPGHSCAKTPWNTHTCMQGCIHTYTPMESTHFHLIKLTYILMPRGQMIIEAQLGCFCAAKESHVGVFE